MKWIVHGVFLFLFMLLAFFGIGPVFLADGAAGERIVTAFFVISTAVFLAIVYRVIFRNFFK
ncbi:hypothetical protein H4O14_10310 [Bacillus sp. PAMC26568]|nr:hypothetical protein CYJ36_19130 [Bacillus sp. UMB0893]QNG58272.1 hypothetical protein H4O14_10310 [Bacillus sp. PAMC26568]